MDKSNKHVYIEHNGKGYHFQNDKDENAKLFMARCWCIVKNSHIPNIRQIADIWMNKKYLKVTYPDNIETMLASLNLEM